ncbi:hypothetical protein [Erwinia sp. E602]|uniref:hypothetical protein n=1 Tax=Erwinia sp. E602 TaxID=2675378 RepID=UPI001BA52FA4|nr:hypothetical protein [Erwinia sp. E602]
MIIIVILMLPATLFSPVNGPDVSILQPTGQNVNQRQILNKLFERLEQITPLSESLQCAYYCFQRRQTAFSQTNLLKE